MATHLIHQARLTKSVELSDQTKHLEFEIPAMQEFPFKPGQFVSITAPRADGKLITRAYSVASAPRANCFDVCLNRVEEGFMSNHLCDLEPGTVVDFHGPHGLFVLREHRQDALFIATGTGIAPFRAMAQWLLADPARHAGHCFWLIYGTRYEKDIYYEEEFRRMAAEHPNFRYVVTLSRPQQEWSGRRGYVQERVREIVGNRQDMQAYICGLNDMVTATRELLQNECGWDRKQIVYERYD
jgi:ferredoxin-NADP reductase